MHLGGATGSADGHKQLLHDILRKCLPYLGDAEANVIC